MASPQLDVLIPGPADDVVQVDHDLIVLVRDRIVFHEHYGTPEQRLRVCFTLLTASDLVSPIVFGHRAAQLYALEIDLFRLDPDVALNRLAKIVRDWGINVYVSTSARRETAPDHLYSVITDYRDGRVVAEHFLSAEARTASLSERAENFFEGPGQIPPNVLASDQSLVSLLMTYLQPVVVTLTDTAFDASKKHYRSDDAGLIIATTGATP